MKWFVLYTRPRAEQKSAEQLEKLGLEVFCPMTTEIRNWSDRKKKVRTPLFKSYVFVRLDENEKNKVFEVSTVVRFLYWLAKPAVVKDKEIETLKTWLNDDAYEDIQVHSLSEGDEVKINSGALKGKKGVVKAVGKREVKLVLESLGFIVTTRLKDVL